REARQVPHPGPGLLRQQGHRRSGQRPGRARRRRLRPAAAPADRFRPLVRPVHARRCRAGGVGLSGCEDRVTISNTGFPYLLLMTVLPLAGALVVGLLPRGQVTLAKRVALLFSLATFGLFVAAWIAYKPNGARLQLHESYAWIPLWNVRFTFAVDGIALVMVALIAIFLPLVILYSWNETQTETGVPAKRSANIYFALLLFLESMMIGVFAAADVFL